MSKIYTFNELKESALIYDRKPPAFGGIITFLTLVFMIAIMFLAAFSVKTSIVNATGIAVSGDKTNIMNRVSGAIERIYVWEGQRVSTGDVLIEIDGYQAELQITQLEANADFYRGKLELMERLIIFINGFTLSIPETRTNPFDENDIDEMKIYADAKTFIDYIVGQEEAASNEEPPREYAQSEVAQMGDRANRNKIPIKNIGNKIQIITNNSQK